MSFKDSASPFADKLGTNYVPSDKEMEDLRSLLTTPIEELARIEAQIDEMDVLIGQLKAKRAALKADINAHSALISPMRRIPDDVLREIFVACLPTAHNALIDPSEAPLLLGLICRHWRSVAYSTPRIWCSIHIPDMVEYDPQHKIDFVRAKLEKCVQAWLDRSGNCPLSISCSYPRHLNRIDAPSADPLTPFPADQLTKVAHRLQHLRFGCHIDDMMPFLLLGPEEVPLLESIDIRDYTDPDNSRPEIWDKIPVLQALNLHRISLVSTAQALTLPLQWSQLTDLSLICYPDWSENHDPPLPAGLDQNDAFELLRRCQNLVRCRFHATIYTSLTATSILTLPYLKTLVLAEDFDMVDFLKVLSLPELCHLELGGTHGGLGIWSWNTERSSHELTVELMPGFEFSQDDLLQLLNLFPSLSSLLIPRRPVPLHLDDTFLDRLSANLDNILCPRLQTIDFGACTFSDSAVLKFILARMNTEYPLRRVVARFFRAMDIDISSELQPFISVNAGLEVNLHHSFASWKFDARQGLSVFH